MCHFINSGRDMKFKKLSSTSFCLMPTESKYKRQKAPETANQFSTFIDWVEIVVRSVVIDQRSTVLSAFDSQVSFTDQWDVSTFIHVLLKGALHVAPASWNKPIDVWRKNNQLWEVTQCEGRCLTDGISAASEQTADCNTRADAEIDGIYTPRENNCIEEASSILL